MSRLVAVGAAVLILTVSSDAEAVAVRARLGQGGLREGRAPDGKLSGGQVALDPKPTHLPVVLSIATE